VNPGGSYLPSSSRREHKGGRDTDTLISPDLAEALAALTEKVASLEATILRIEGEVARAVEQVQSAVSDPLALVRAAIRKK
jgi:hypothetical protein